MTPSDADWHLLEVVGEGATAVVHRAERAARAAARGRPAREVAAVKVAKHEPGAAVVAAEVALLRALARRWGPTLRDAGPGWLATSWTEGLPLDAAEPSPDPRTRRLLAATVAHGVGRGLDELHSMNVRHGDVKRANVILSPAVPTRDGASDRGATLIDVGLATRGDGFLGGTPRYLAPEIRAGEAPTLAADLFALGILLAELVHPELVRLDDPAAGAASWAAKAGPDDDVASWIQILVSPTAGARPAAAWVADRAAELLRLTSDPEERIAARRARVRRAYLAVRRGDLQRGGEPTFDGPTREWLDEATAFVGERGRPAIAPLDRFGRTRWVAALVGPAAAGFRLEDDESTLAARMLALCEVPPEAWTEEDLAGGARAVRSAPLPTSGDARWIAMTRGLSRPSPSAELCRAVEEDVTSRRAPSALAYDLSRALLRRGEIGRAHAAAAHAPDDAESDALRADLARRRGDRATAEALARKLGARALLGRLAWEAGDLARATAELGDETGAAAAEVRGLVAYGEGAPERGLHALDAAAPDDALSAARLAATRGMLEHARGRAASAMRAFETAVDIAAREGAVVEEATYRTGLAAAAADAGHVETALASATRAAVSWERLGRPGLAARALLSRAAAFALVGASHEADVAADLAREQALATHDARAAAFARWAKVETRPHGDEIARAEALAADEELARVGDADDRIRSAARLLLWTASARPSSLDAIDERVAPRSAAARWEWWGARAATSSSQRVLAELVALLDTPAPLASRGPALAAAVKLARELGDGDAARRLEVARREAADVLRAGTPSSLRASLSSIGWARHATETSPAFHQPQLEQLEAIVRALSSRDRLKPLLEQVLDTMVLWTGVERGLLLLRAPDGRLVPRAARNLARRDLHGEQLDLSTSLAMRAMAERQTICATDALADLGDLHASVHALRLRSVLAVPLVARGDVLGVVYLDDRVRRNAFGPSELAWVRLVSSQAALAIADARDQALLRRAVRRAERATKRLAEDLGAREVELAQARADLGETRFRYDAIAGRSEPMRKMLKLVDRVTTTEVPVLVIGESGTGKELVARAIHDNGARKTRPFVSENCASVPETLLESTLFGHVRGAFTGASGTRAGLFDIADGGTLFLDEIGEMSLAMQAKLLRVLQNGEVRPVGSEKTHRVEVRIIAATHRDLAAMVAAGSFREDLFYRLDVVTIRVPPLRERAADVPLLVAHFVAAHGGPTPKKVTRAAMERLVTHPWPGNVRQLENEVRRALVVAEDKIDLGDLSDDVARGGAAVARDTGLGLRGKVDALETTLVKDALARAKGNQTRAAEALGLSRFGLQKMMRRLGVEPR